MASTSTLRASSSSSSIPRWEYDAFLSFCGEDTRNCFTDHLHYVLKLKGFHVFRDDEKLERGKYVGDGLLKAIQESRYAIVVISANYAFSKWCLIELVEILECMRGLDMRVLPVFYRVDPSDVRNQTGTFAEAFARHEKDPKVDDDKMQKWRAALKEVGDIAGWHVEDGPESVVVEKISGKMLCGLSHNFSNVSNGLVGTESRVKEMESMLGIGLDDVRFLGIWGMGGIGKTTLAHVIYQRIKWKFEATCFIRNVREETEKRGLLHLQKQVISKILGESETNIQNDPCVATNMIASKIRQRSVLIILDDMDEDEQVEKLAGSHDWFGQGSRIIITSRDLHFLKKVPVDKTYKVEGLNNTEALELFSSKAFKKPHPEENYVELSKDIVNYAQGLPLALKVFGSSLFGRKMDAWKSARDLHKENPDAEILDKLRISYDGLTDTQKDLLLDIACFYNGAYMDRIKHKLESFGYYPNFNIEVLVEKSLITISRFGRLEMHDLLRKMGQEIVLCESTKEPGERSRLWCNKDVIHVLKNNIGTNAVSSIVLKLPLQKQERLNVEAFSKMINLKMLQISLGDVILRPPTARDNLCITLEWHGDPSKFMLSDELRVLEWLEYPYESLPTNFRPDNLVELIMRNSCIKQLWVGSNSLCKLKYIDLRHSQHLIEIPDLNGVLNLEKLELEGCTSLSRVHPSIGSLRRLTRLNLDGCSSLEKIPKSVGNLTSLETLNISHCSRLEKIPKNLLSDMKCLNYFYARGVDPIKSLLLPNSLSNLSSLRELDLSYCNLSYEAIPSDLSCLSQLFALRLNGNKFTRIPDSVAQLSHLSKLDLSDCSQLQVLPKLPLGLMILLVKNCPSLWLSYKQMEIMWRTSNEKLRSNVYCSFVEAYIDYDGKPFKILHLHPRSPLWTNRCENKFHRFDDEALCGHALVGSGIPEWFNDKSTNSFGTIQLHSILGSNQWFSWLDFRGYAVFIVYEFHEPHTTHPYERNFPIFVCHFQFNGVDFEKPLVLFAHGVPSVGPNRFWAYIPSMWFKWNKLRLTSGGGFLEASITTVLGSLNVEVKECGARVVRDEHDAFELYQLLNTISPLALGALDFESYLDCLYTQRANLEVLGPIIIESNFVASGSIGSANLSASFKKKQKV